jgi:chromosome segregation ATPase
MKGNIKILEERIHNVLGRLREIRDERDRLRDELEGLQRTLDEVQAERPGGVSAEVAPETAVVLVAIKSAPQEAIQELRGD